MSEQEGFRPTGGRAKSGKCALCGARARLTKAHVPPRAAFNNGSFSWGGTTAGNRLAHGRPRLGGASLYAHCEPCRAATSPWDDEYIRWAYTFAGNLLHSQWKGERTHIEGKLNEVRPGRFIRSALAGMTALTPKLIDSHLTWSGPCGMESQPQRQRASGSWRRSRRTERRRSLREHTRAWP